MKGKNEFTKTEIEHLKDMIKKKCSASKNEQKVIRDKIRSIGFYYSDFSSTKGYTPEGFEELILMGFIKVKEEDSKIDASLPLSLDEIKRDTISSSESNSKPKKLIPIAELICELLETKFKIKPSYSLESTKEWLRNSPSFDDHAMKWEKISHLYSLLVDNKWMLNSVIRDNFDKINYGKQRIDIWFEEPYNFIFEFDESQHFNQFRLMTLEKYDEYNQSSFDLKHYLSLTRQKIVKPGTSGFQKLKTFDPLFPPMLEGEKQDNRFRQRAFRDFLKDITPALKGFNPTIRISYQITNSEIEEFSESGLARIKEHILQRNLLSKIVLK